MFSTIFFDAPINAFAFTSSTFAGSGLPGFSADAAGGEALAGAGAGWCAAETPEAPPFWPFSNSSKYSCHDSSTKPRSDRNRASSPST
jgi:hypothetical protein